MLAKDFDEFVSKALHGIQNGLNSKAGQDLTKELLRNALAKNQNTTAEEWDKLKQDFMFFCFATALKETPELWNEFAAHVWEEIQSKAELKTSRETAAKLEAELDKHYGLISTTPEQYRREQEDFYDGIFYATEILFAVKRDEQGKHHIKPYPTD